MQLVSHIFPFLEISNGNLGIWVPSAVECDIPSVPLYETAANSLEDCKSACAESCVRLEYSAEKNLCYVYDKPCYNAGSLLPSIISGKIISLNF